MKGLREYIFEAVARRNSGKYMEPNRDSIVKWLKTKGFKEFEYSPNMEHLNYNGNSYMEMTVNDVPKNISIDAVKEWISIHTKRIHDITIWFDKEGNALDGIRMRRVEHIPSALAEQVTLDQLNDILLNK